MPSTYSEFQALPASEKTVLAIVEAAKRLQIWENVSGDLYKITFTDSSVIVTLENNGVALTSVLSEGAVGAGDYYFDKNANEIFLELADSSDPNDITLNFVGVSFRLYFSNTGVRAPHDLALGFDVDWLPQIKSTSQFGVQIDNKETQLGSALEGSGRITLHNDQSFWVSRFDKLIFENQRIEIYSYNREIPATEAMLIFRGRIQGKSYTPEQVQFALKDVLNELRNALPLTELSEFSYTHDLLGVISARVTETELRAKQRQVYGRLSGHRLQSVDKIITGIPLPGTFSATLSSKVITPTSTANMQRFTAGDVIIFSGQPLKEYTVQSLTGTTTFSISELFQATTQAGMTAILKPKNGGDSFNRYYQIAGHPVTTKATTITEVFTPRYFKIASSSSIEEGDAVVINGEQRQVSRLNGPLKDFMELDFNLTGLPIVTDAVTRSGIRGVFYQGERLIEGASDDYTVDATNALVKLNRDLQKSPEFRIAPITEGQGTMQFVNSALIHGGGTSQFRDDLQPGDWISPNKVDWLKVFSINLDDNVTTSFTWPNATTALAAYFIKRPVYIGDSSVISADVIGRSDDNTTSGEVLALAPEIVKDVLTQAGLASEIEAASFDTFNDILSQHKIAFAAPGKAGGTDTQPVRTIINNINRSVFGVLFQNNDFELEYSALDPVRLVSSARTYREVDALRFSIKNQADKIVRTVTVRYANEEANKDSLSTFFQNEVKQNPIALYLVKTGRELVVDTFLTSEASATIFASRWVFLLAVGRALLTIDTKLQGADLNINNVIDFKHSKLYQRFGSESLRKVALVSAVKKDGLTTKVTMDDLAGAFTRCSTITSNFALGFSSSDEQEKVFQGYITDDDGIIDSDASNFGLNLIW